MPNGTTFVRRHPKYRDDETKKKGRALLKPAFLFFLVGWCLPLTLVAQVFDERMSDWPVDFSQPGVVMVDSETNPTDPIFQDLVRAAGEKPQVVAVAFDDPSQLEKLKTQFEGVESFRIYQWGIEADEVQQVSADSKVTEPLVFTEAVKNANAVVLCARQPLKEQARRWLGKQATHFQACLQRGGVVLGCGNVGPSFGRFERVEGRPGHSPRESKIIPGLNLLPDVVLQTGFPTATARENLLSVLAEKPKMIGIGMDPKTCLVLRGRKVAATGSGNLHFFTAANLRVPLREKTIRQPKTKRFNPYESLVDLTAWRREAIDRTLEIFPPENPAVPCVPQGTLMIVGGGGMPQGLMEQFIEQAGGKRAKLLYVPCTEKQDLSSRDFGLVKFWQQQGVASASVFHTKNRIQANQDDAFLEPLREATGIFFGGGRQWNFADSYYGTKAHQLMKEVLQRGGVIAGSSAGASIQARYLARANPLGNIDIMAAGYERGGLGFISGVAIDQHFTQRRRQADMSSLVNRYPQLLGIGIDERTAIIVQKSLAKVIGEGDVYFYDRESQSSTDQPDFLKVPAGKEYDLAKREVVDEH